MPTISASRALATLDAPSTQRFVRTGLRRLDTILRAAKHTSSEDVSSGGFPRGQISEIYGPPGVGKTAFAMQASANALLEGEHVVWVGLSPRTSCRRFALRPGLQLTRPYRLCKPYSRSPLYGNLMQCQASKSQPGSIIFASTANDRGRASGRLLSL